MKLQRSLFCLSIDVFSGQFGSKPYVFFCIWQTYVSYDGQSTCYPGSYLGFPPARQSRLKAVEPTSITSRPLSSTSNLIIHSSFLNSTLHNRGGQLDHLRKPHFRKQIRQSHVFFQPVLLPYCSNTAHCRRESGLLVVTPAIQCEILPSKNNP